MRLTLILLMRLAAAQLDQGDASMIAWRAYGQFIKNYMTAGQPLKQGLDYLFVTPPTEFGIRGGTPVPEAVTNWDLTGRADVLQTPDSPLFEITGPSYIDSLQTYLGRARTAVPILTDDQAAKMNQLDIDWMIALDKYQTEMDKATDRWSNDATAQAAGTPLDVWARTKAPLYIAYRDQFINADARREAYSREVYGSDPILIRDKILNLGKDKALNEGYYVPGYNMPVFPGSFTPVLNPFPTSPVEKTSGLVYRPLYTISGLEEACDAWFKGTAGGTTVLDLSLKDVRGSDWSQLGHSVSVSKKGGGLFGIISKTKTTTKVTTEFNSWSERFMEEVQITLTMQGAPLIFNIGAGFWDVADVRNIYPTLYNGTDPLVGKIRTQKILLGYGVSLNMTFNNVNTWNSVYRFVEDVRKDSSWGLRIFGFAFGGSGGGSSYIRDKNVIQTETRANGGSIYIPPTAPGLTFMLGAQGRKY